MLPNASEFLAINANLLIIAFGRAFAREIRYMGEQYYFYIPNFKLLAFFCGCKGLFVLDLVRDPEDLSSHEIAHLLPGLRGCSQPL